LKQVDLVLPDPAEVSDESIAPVLSQLAAMQTALAAHLLVRASDKESHDDRLLSIDEAATKLKTSKDWLYRNSGRLPFTLRIGRNLRFSEQGIERWIVSRTGRI
jgi:excisionase family DNA binding protein